jgi:transcriptional regulator with XRE-family HTH domain
MAGKPDGTPDAKATEGPNPIDRHVGARIRLRRMEIGLSQDRLAEAVGVSFQQIQKYERGTNRVSASMLWEIAGVLRCSVTSLFEGLGDDGPPVVVSSPILDFLVTAEGRELAQVFDALPAGPVKRRIIELIRTLAQDRVERP